MQEIRKLHIACPPHPASDLFIVSGTLQDIKEKRKHSRYDARSKAAVIKHEPAVEYGHVWYEK